MNKESQEQVDTMVDAIIADIKSCDIRNSGKQPIVTADTDKTDVEIVDIAKC